jgi:arginine-tRNA-protein transferase
MAQWLDAFTEPPHPCPYLPGEVASLDVRLAVDVSSAEFGAMLDRGWRRFGPSYFRPGCRACSKCIPTRVRAAEFRASKSQKRARNQSAGLMRHVGLPIVDDERLELYARWHANRETHRGWEAMPLTAEHYTLEFAFPHPSVREVTFRDPRKANRLVGLGIVDEVPDALSAVYFFWDPVDAPSSLGTAHVVRLIDDAVARGMSYVYLGYTVEGCPSLAYKARFQPQESLAGWPDGDEPPAWSRDAPER